MNNSQSASEIVQQFHSGTLFYIGGVPIVEMYEYSISPARIDGLEDKETLAIRLEGESEAEGLTPVSHTAVVPFDPPN